MDRYMPGQPVLTNNHALYDGRVYTDTPVLEIRLPGNVQRTTDPAISKLVVDLIAACLDPSATSIRSYFFRIETVNGKVSIAGSTDSSMMRDAYRKCLVRIKAEIKGVNGIDDVGVVHASDPKPQWGDGLMDTAACAIGWMLGRELSPTSTIRVDHSDNVIYVRGSVPYVEDYKIVSSLVEELPMFPHVSRIDFSGVLCSGFNKPLQK